MAAQHDALITKHASANGVPESLVRRVIYIESKGNPRIISKGNFGLMQIRLGTARSMGYTGTAEGLLDADTNMTYAVKYLAGAYRAAGCSEARAISYYQRGFYKKLVSSCGPRAVQVAARKEPEPAAPAKAQQLTAGERIAAPFEALRPKVVQVQTIVRPKTFNVAVQSVQTQSAATPAAGSAPVEAKATDVQLPPSPPLPRPAQRPEVAGVQTVAKAPDAEQSWPPALTPEQPAEVMLPMPKPRPAKAPKALAKLEVTGQDVMAKQDAAASEVAATKQAPAEADKPAESSDMQQVAKLDPQAVPLPQPRPETDETPEHEGKPGRHASHRPAHYRSRRPETPALIAFFQKLTTPAHQTRRRR